MIKWIKGKIESYKKYRYLLKLAKDKPLACWHEIMRDYWRERD